jgi:hypothetical protein
MYHHYGRHGPRAWLRRRQRRWKRSLPAIVPTVAVVRIRVPITTERIILIIMPEPNNEFSAETREISGKEMQPLQQNMTVQAAPPRQVTGDGQKDTPSLSPIARRADWHAIDDVDEVKKKEKAGIPILVDKDKLAGRARNQAKREIREALSKGEIQSDLKYEDLITEYLTTYTQVFHEKLGSALYPPRAIQLIETAIQDKKKFPYSWRRPFHQRDLAVLQVLMALELSFDTALEHLEEIHEYADLYERYFANPREVVIWPDQEPFRE